MPQFYLSVHSITLPDLPEQPADAKASDFRSSLIRSNPLEATSPLYLTLELSSARDNNPLYPATHLQLSFDYRGSGEIFIPDVINANELIKVEFEEETRLYTLEVPPEHLPRAKVSTGGTSTAEVNIHAWRNEKFLGKWTVARIERLGIVGLKPHRMATEVALDV